MSQPNWFRTPPPPPFAISHLIILPNTPIPFRGFFLPAPFQTPAFIISAFAKHVFKIH